MKKLFIVRHGDYDDKNGRLNECGKAQVTKLAEFIQTNLNGSSVLVLSSTAPRALDSAEVMAKVLATTNIKKVEELWNDNTHRGNSKISYETIKTSGIEPDVVIAITHFEFTGYLPKYFFRDLNIDACCSAVGKGKAWEIDFENCKVERVPK